MGEARQLEGKHAAPFTVDEARWLCSTLLWIESQTMDARRKATCKRVACFIVAHIEGADSLPDGLPFASVSTTTLADEIGIKRDTVHAAIRAMTCEGGPLSVVWKPTKGQRLGTCYAFHMPDNPRDLTGKSIDADMPDNTKEITGKSDSDHMPDNSFHMPDNSFHMPDNPALIGPPIPIPIGARGASHAPRDARAVEGPDTRSPIDTSSVMSMEEIRAINAANEAAMPA